jgi:hypothetical protein
VTNRGSSPPGLHLYLRRPPARTSPWLRDSCAVPFAVGISLLLVQGGASDQASVARGGCECLGYSVSKKRVLGVFRAQQ